MMRIVLDTNVLVAGLLSAYAAPAKVIQLILANRVRVCFDVRIVAEYRQVLARPKFHFEPRDIKSLISYMEQSGELTASLPWSLHLPDPDDAMFLEVALAAQADYLVTGNIKHFPKKSCRNAIVVSPAQFIDLW